MKAVGIKRFVVGRLQLGLAERARRKGFRLQIIGLFFLVPGLTRLPAIFGYKDIFASEVLESTHSSFVVRGLWLEFYGEKSL